MRRAAGLADTRGAVLIEAIMALAMLAAIGSAAAWLASESIHAVSRASVREADVRSAANFLTAVSLWPRDDLDRHLGSTPQGPWLLRVDRPRPTLYEVRLTDSSGSRLILATALHRPEAAR